MNGRILRPFFYFRMTKPSQNSPCPCGSGKKFKRCCGAIQSAKNATPSIQSLHKTRQILDAAMLCQQQGDFVGASRLFEQLVSLHPEDSAFLGLRGMVAFEQKQFDEAEQWLNKAILLSQDDSRLYNFLGQIAAAKGDDYKAEVAFGRAATIDPDFFEAWSNLALTLRRSGQLREAVSAYQKALSLSAGEIHHYLELTEIFYLLGEADKAADALNKAISLGGLNAGASVWQSLLSRAAGELPKALEAEALFLALAKHTDESIGWLVKVARLDVQLGNIEQAEYWLTQAIRIDPNHPAAYVELAGTRKFRDADRILVSKMEVLTKQQNSYIRPLEFALGKVYTDLGEYSLSFEHYKRANLIALETNHFEAAALVESVAQKISLFTPDFIEKLPKGSDSDLPILIVGTPRSGTTLTEQIVSSHSQVQGAGELMFWGRLGDPVMQKMRTYYSHNVATTLANGYLGILERHASGVSRVTDKMPGNFSYIGLIHAVFPKAKIIHCRRHPIDACLSMYFQDFGDNQEFHFSLEGLAVYYEQYVRLMDHWRNVLPDGVMYELRYENLVEDMEGETHKLMSFLGLEWEEAQMEFFKRSRPVFTHSMWQVRQPIYKTSKD